MKTLKDRVVAVTGAGSGIGRATAVEPASRGCTLAKEFLPYLKQSGEGHIVNVSSLFGIITFPPAVSPPISSIPVALPAINAGV